MFPLLCCIVIVVMFEQRLPSTIGSLKKLQVLDLEENKLEFLPPEIGTWHMVLTDNCTDTAQHLARILSTVSSTVLYGKKTVLVIRHRRDVIGLPIVFLFKRRHYIQYTGHFLWLVWSPGTVKALDIRSAPTLSTFKNMLKTHLFSRSYFTNYFQSTNSEHCTAPL